MTNPLAWLLFLAISGWLLRRKLWFALTCAISGALLLVAMTPPVAYGLVRLWESDYAAEQLCRRETPDIIVLLPAGVRRPIGRRGFPTLTHRSLIRLERALALSVAHGGVPILISGTDQETNAMQEVAGQWGRAAEFVLLGGSANTLQAAEAASKHPAVGGSNVWLVTSAMHMRRSQETFAHFGAETCAAPVDFTEGWRGLLPDHLSTGRLDRLLHEMVGLAYYRIRFRLD